MFYPSTFFCTRKNASHFSLSGTKKRQLPRTLGDRYQHNCFRFHGEGRSKAIVNVITNGNNTIVNICTGCGGGDWLEKQSHGLPDRETLQEARRRNPPEFFQTVAASALCTMYKPTVRSLCVR